MRGGSVDSLSDAVGHWLEAGALPPELVTGHKLIDFEHRFLIGAIANLRKVCGDYLSFKDCAECAKSMQERCEGSLIGLLGDVFAFILDHFKNEEAIMRDSLMQVVDRDVCEAHMEDHAEIAAKVQEIVSALDTSHIVSRIRDLDALLSRWVNNHISLHDMLLARWVARSDALIDHG
ncbi:hemerythrin family protein [Dechloromonas sp. XY25]|uniref:Hemerythrin family protein n=1 Tax=Dechloromonas hankyongensis TaxID=2908002 RepID=A0ABS9K4Z0_9RHOO|nr:hemerythrin family protein [Dechloromonas hankyongensis]MCG2578232.1 hemerythrin family protein [Dechloromonas hankyongensis]